MITMTDINTIRNLRNAHGKSIREISRILDVDWRTAKKYADEDINPVPEVKVKKGMMYTEKWGEIVSCWIEEDSRLPRKKRRTNKQFYLDLVEIGFQGSYRTVCDYVASWKQTHINEDDYDEGYNRLEHPRGEAQLDFGTMEVAKDGKLVDIKVLVMVFPYSNRSFAVCLPSENQECLLEGMKKIFDMAGGVPRKIRIDNMATAVVKSKHKGQAAVLTDEFPSFSTYYSFEVQTCNPRSGHEKGSVENKVGYIRYNFFSASPIFDSFETLTQQLNDELSMDSKKTHYMKTDRTVEELLGRGAAAAS